MFLLHLIGEMEDSRLVVSLWRIQALPGAMYAIPFCGDHQLSSRRSCFTGEATSGVLSRFFQICLQPVSHQLRTPELRGLTA